MDEKREKRIREHLGQIRQWSKQMPPPWPLKIQNKLDKISLELKKDRNKTQ